jgi:hypothetical protein
MGEKVYEAIELHFRHQPSKEKLVLAGRAGMPRIVAISFHSSFAEKPGPVLRR